MRFEAILFAVALAATAFAAPLNNRDAYQEMSVEIESSLS